MARAALTVAAIRSPSSLAGMTTATRWVLGRRFTLRAYPGRCSSRRSTGVSAQRDLAGDDAGPGAAGVGVEGPLLGERSLELLLETGAGLDELVRLGAGVELPHRDEDPAGAEGADEPGPLLQLGLAAGVEPGDGVQDILLRLGPCPAEELPAHPAPVGGGDAVDRDGGDDALAGLLDGGRDVGVLALVLGEPEPEVVVQDGLEGHAEAEHVLQARAGLEDAEVGHRGAGLGLECE